MTPRASLFADVVIMHTTRNILIQVRVFAFSVTSDSELAMHFLEDSKLSVSVAKSASTAKYHPSGDINSSTRSHKPDSLSQLLSGVVRGSGQSPATTTAAAAALPMTVESSDETLQKLIDTADDMQNDMSFGPLSNGGGTAAAADPLDPLTQLSSLDDLSATAPYLAATCLQSSNSVMSPGSLGLGPNDLSDDYVLQVLSNNLQSPNVDMSPTDAIVSWENKNKLPSVGGAVSVAADRDTSVRSGSAGDNSNAALQIQQLAELLQSDLPGMQQSQSHQQQQNLYLHQLRQQRQQQQQQQQRTHMMAVVFQQQQQQRQRHRLHQQQQQQQQHVQLQAQRLQDLQRQQANVSKVCLCFHCSLVTGVNKSSGQMQTFCIYPRIHLYACMLHVTLASIGYKESPLFRWQLFIWHHNVQMQCRYDRKDPFTLRANFFK